MASLQALELLREALLADTNRGNGVVAHLPPLERLAAMLACIAAEALYERDYLYLT